MFTVLKREVCNVLDCDNIKKNVDGLQCWSNVWVLEIKQTWNEEYKKLKQNQIMSRRKLTRQDCAHDTTGSGARS